MTKNIEQNEVFDTHADAYSEEIDKSLNRFGTSHDFFTEHKAKLIAVELAAMGKAPGEMALLDVGCGVGKIHAPLKGQFRKISGVDLSAPSIKVARETYPENDYQAYEGGRLPFEDGAVDMTLAICVIHHVPPDLWQEFADEMIRVLRPGGVAMVIEHNPFNPVTRRIVNTCPLDEDAVLVTPKKLRALFRRAGAEEVKTRTVLSVPPKSDALMKLDRVLGHLPLGAQYVLTARKKG